MDKKLIWKGRVWWCDLAMKEGRYERADRQTHGLGVKGRTDRRTRKEVASEGRYDRADRQTNARVKKQGAKEGMNGRTDRQTDARMKKQGAKEPRTRGGELFFILRQPLLALSVNTQRTSCRSGDSLVRRSHYSLSLIHI